MQTTRSKFIKAYHASGGGPLLFIRPSLALLPLPMQRYDEPLLPFGKALIAATSDVVTGYLFDLAAYLSLGAAGAIALERTIGVVQATQTACALVHGPFANDDYALAMGKTAFCADGVTVTETAQIDGFHMHAILTARVPASGIPEQLLLPEIDLTLSVCGDETIYRSRDDDFAAVIRSAVLDSRTAT